MGRILLINACFRPESRTLRLVKHLLTRLEGSVSEVNLEEEGIAPLNSVSLKHRQEILEQGRFDDPMLRYARQFRQADVIVIAAPYYDLSFPSALKVYLEAVCCVGLTFYYDEQQMPQTLCRCQKLYYVSTGGGELYKSFGYDYVKAVMQEFFHVPEVASFLAENLDQPGSDPESILNQAKREVDRHFT